MAKYYTLLGKTETHEPWEIITGAYERELVEEELEAEQDQAFLFGDDPMYYHHFKIICTDEDQEAIDWKIQSLNG